MYYIVQKCLLFLHHSWDMSVKFPKIPQRRLSRKYFIEFLHAGLSVREDRQGEYIYYNFDTFSLRIKDEQSYVI